MGRTLRTVGGILLLAGAWLLLAGSFGWVPEPFADGWGLNLFLAGAAALGVGVFLAVTGPWARWLAGARCVRCRRRIERGQTYCMDHLRETLDEYRDRKNAASPIR